MIVGIDASCLTETPSGVGYHCLNIIEQLHQNQVDVILFTATTISHKSTLLNQLKKVQGKAKHVISRKFWRLITLPRLIKQKKIDVFWGPAHYLPPFLPKKIVKAVTIHDLVWLKAPNTMKKSNLLFHKMKIPQVFRRANLIITSSLSTENDLKSAYPKTTKKVVTCYCGPKGGPLNQCHNNQVQDRLIILCTGTIEPRKNHARLLMAYSQLPDRLKQSHPLVIAGGNGWGNINLKQLIEQLGIKSHVRLTGYVTNEQLTQLYQQAYCLVMPSLYEGFGLPILEAQGFGVPVITSTNSSMPEVAGNGALLVDPLSITSIRKQLQTLLEDPRLREQLSSKALKNVRRFSWQKAGLETQEAFQACLQKRCEITHG
jgi:glycosyltransferase involved in cell wall biosynthesis